MKKQQHVVTPKATGKWRETTYKGKPVVVDPSGQVYYGTVKEISECRLSPWARKSLAQALKVYRYVYKDDRSAMMSVAAERRRDYIRGFRDFYQTTMLTLPSDIAVLAEASARRHGETVQEWIVQWFKANFEAKKDDERSETGRREIPLTKREREFLERFEK